jgi:hypothetical protein
MSLIWVALILVSLLGVAVDLVRIEHHIKMQKLDLQFFEEREKPLNVDLLPKAFTIDDLNQLAINMCNRGLAIVMQCVEKSITHPYSRLSPFCQDVVDTISRGHDLTIDVQYLWGFLPVSSESNRGTLYDVFNGEQVSELNEVRDLPSYIRYLITQFVAQEYNTYFWSFPTYSFRYIKPTDRERSSPCAYSGIITFP